MSQPDTAEVITRFNDAFLHRDPAALVDLIADRCVMESAQPAPNGTRYEGHDACLRFWQELITDADASFEPEDVVVTGDGQPSAGATASAKATRTPCAAST